ncbi:MAG: hypothetical protein KDK39_05340 [Leptospiraceae bacterium]|nr:hypothetical protein [Leptospiraceae bacterium]
MQWLALYVFLTGLVFFGQSGKAGDRWPAARSGDEPHYLVLLDSLVHDQDLLVQNNYASPRASQGRYLRGVALDHHSVLVHPDRQDWVLWDECYFMQWTGLPPRWFEQHYKDSCPPGEHLTYYQEYGWHPPGYPLLLAICVGPWMLAGLAHYESLIVALQLAFFSLAVFRLRRLGPVSWPALAVLSLLVPASYYNAVFYTEGLSASLVLLAWTEFERKRFGWSGVWLALLAFIKESYFPFVPLFGVFAFWQSGRPGQAAKLMAPALLALLAFFYRSWLIYGGPFFTYLPWQSNTAFWSTLTGAFFSPVDGLFVFTPLLVWAPLALWIFARQRGRLQALLITSLLLYQFGLVHASVHWSGGPTYAHRLMVPVLTLLLWPLWISRPTGWVPGQRVWPRRLRWLWTLLATVSVLNTVYALGHLQNSWNQPAWFNLWNWPSSQALR